MGTPGSLTGFEGGGEVFGADCSLSLKFEQEP
jgi:hypothetical protein